MTHKAVSVSLRV